MDWQIRIALIVAGLLLIGYIYYDFNRRKKRAIKNQKLIDDMRRSAQEVDSQGFDITGVSSARTLSGDDTLVRSNSETSNNTSSDDSHKNNHKNSSNDDSVNTSSSEAAPQQMAFASLEETDLLNNYQANEQDPELVISLILQAEIGYKYKGKDFMPLFLSQGLRHGDMQIFHRYDTNNKSKPDVTLFKVASAVQPGTFSMHNIEQFSTQAFAFFVNLPGPQDPVAAYQAMIKSMNFFSEELGGCILNQDKSPYDEDSYRKDIYAIRNYMVERIEENRA